MIVIACIDAKTISISLIKSHKMENTKILLIVVLALLGLAFLTFIIHTIRCYLTKPQTDEDDENEYRLQYNKGEGTHPI